MEKTEFLICGYTDGESNDGITCVYTGRPVVLTADEYKEEQRKCQQHTDGAITVVILTRVSVEAINV